MTKKSIISFLAVVIASLFSFGCSKTIYVPVEKTEYVAVHDTTYLHKTDTLVKVPEVSIADFIDVKDTLVMQTGIVTSKSWVDTTMHALKGRLVQSGKLPVQIVERERVVYRDSIIKEQVPYPVVEEKIVKVVPLFWRIGTVIGLLALCALALWAGFKFL